MKKYFNFEIYTSDPLTKTTGWEIKTVSVKAENKQEAKEKLKNFPNFDVIILFNFSHEENENCDFFTTQLYPEFKILERY